MPDNRGDPMPALDDKFLKERYDYELARKDKISDSIGLPVTVLIVLGGLIVTMLRGFSYTKPGLTVAFLALVAITAASYVCCLWFFAHAYHGPQLYERLPSLNDLYKALNDYRIYYNDDDTRANEDFEDNLRWRIIQAADQNTASNNARQRHLHLGIVWLFAVVVGTAVSSVPYAIDQVIAPAKAPVTAPGQP